MPSGNLDRRMGWIGSRSFQKTNMKKVRMDMFNAPAFTRAVGDSIKQGRKNPKNH